MESLVLGASAGDDRHDPCPVGDERERDVHGLVGADRVERGAHRRARRGLDDPLAQARAVGDGDAAEPADAPPNTLGLRSVMFAVDDVDDTVARLRAHGGELIGEVADYGDVYRLCYLRGPAGVIVALAEQLS